MVWNRRLVLLERLKRRENDIALALAPGKAKKGDLICILHGCSVPVVLRKIVNGKAEVKRKQCEVSMKWSFRFEVWEIISLPFCSFIF